MNSRKSTKHALYLSFISMILCMTMLLGTTFAWFTDEVTSTNNIIKSGTLDATMEYSIDNVTWNDASKGPIFNYKLWEPGYSDMKYVKIANVGDLAFKYQLNIAPNTPRNDEGLSLADVIEVYYDIVDDDFVAPTKDNKFGNLTKVGTLTQLMAETDGAAHGVLNAKTALTACIVLHMQESAGNEYQGIWVGQSDKEKGFAVQLLASQYTKEEDSFNSLYDEKAPTPVAGSVTVKKNGTQPADAVIPNTNGESTTLGYANIPAAAFAGDEVTLKIEEVATNGNIKIEADQSAKTYEITAIGLKENNTEKINVRLYVGEGLSGLKLYHNEEEIDILSYSAPYITFQTTSFSPFTVVYDKEYVEPEEPEIPKIDANGDGVYDVLPVATVTEAPEHVNCEISDLGSQKLDAAYIFTTLDGDYDAFKDWYCDYYVMIDRDIEEEQIFLAGNYGTYGWIGFTNPDPVEADKEVPLLGSVVTNQWTYGQIASLVGEFTCGVARANDKYNEDGTHPLAGATFTVMLRLTNPENPKEYYNVNTVEYTFDDTPSIGNGTARW